MSPSNPYDSGVKGQDPNVPTFVHLAMCKTGHISIMLKNPGDKSLEYLKVLGSLICCALARHKFIFHH